MTRRRRPRPRASRTSSSSSRSSVKMSCWNSYDVISVIAEEQESSYFTRGSESFTGAGASLVMGAAALVVVGHLRSRWNPVRVNSRLILPLIAKSHARLAHEMSTSLNTRDDQYGSHIPQVDLLFRAPSIHSSS